MMGHTDYSYLLPPCANCGLEHGGHMTSTSWGHSYSCCSDKCGFGLKSNRRFTELQLRDLKIQLFMARETVASCQREIETLEKQLASPE